jgi:hypothetical protein
MNASLGCKHCIYVIISVRDVKLQEVAVCDQRSLFLIRNRKFRHH